MYYIIAFKNESFFAEKYGSVYQWWSATRYTDEQAAKHIACAIGGVVLAILPNQDLEG